MAEITKFTVCIYFLMVMRIIFAGSPPTMLGTKDRLHVIKAGDSVKLRCRASGSEDENLGQRTLFFWTKTKGENKGIIKPQKYPRFEIRQGKYLHITNVQPDDEGTYLCTARNANGIDSVIRTLQVVGLPEHKADHSTKKTAKPPALKIPFSLGDVESSPLVLKPRNLKNEKIFSIGDDMRLKCVIKADPKAIIKWLYNGNMINIDSSRTYLAQDNSSLRINALRMPDAGNYSCIATNKLGKVQVEFSVSVEKSIDLTKTYNSVAYVDSNLTLICKVQLPKRKGFLPRVQWRRRLVGFEFEDRFISPVEDDIPTERKRKRDSGFLPIEKERWRFNMLTNRTLETRFTISNNVSYEDAGLYTCYVGKPSNWRRVHTIIVEVLKASERPDSPTSIDNKDEFPIYILIGFPIAAGILCFAIVFLCWRHSKKAIPHQPAIRSKIVKREDKSRHVHLSICTKKCKSCRDHRRPHSDMEVTT